MPNASTLQLETPAPAASSTKHSPGCSKQITADPPPPPPPPPSARARAARPQAPGVWGPAPGFWLTSPPLLLRSRGKNAQLWPIIPVLCGFHLLHLAVSGMGSGAHPSWGRIASELAPRRRLPCAGPDASSPHRRSAHAFNPGSSAPT